MQSWEDEVWRKTIDQVAHLYASWEAGMITSETFRIAVESINACVSGLINAPEWAELMADANAEAYRMPVELRTEVFRKAGVAVVIMRRDDRVRIIRAKDIAVAGLSFPINTKAVAKIEQIKATLTESGYRRESLLELADPERTTQ